MDQTVQGYPGDVDPSLDDRLDDRLEDHVEERLEASLERIYGMEWTRRFKVALGMLTQAWRIAWRIMRR